MLTTVYTHDSKGNRVTFKREFLTDAEYAKAMSSLVIVCADIMPFLVEKRQVVLATRRHKPAAHVWEFGGRVNAGESTVAAAVRKMKQETGLTIDPEDLTLLGYPRYFWPEREQHPQDMPSDCLVFTYSVPIAEADIDVINAGLDPEEYVAGSARAYDLDDLHDLYVKGNLHEATYKLYLEIFPRQS